MLIASLLKLPDLAALPAVRADAALLSRLLDWAGGLALNLVLALLTLVATFWIARWVSGSVRRALGRVHRNSPDTTLQSFGSSLVRYAIVAIGLVAVLQQLGVKTTSILAVLGAASLAIGLALQGALSNVAAGVMILLFRPYRVGDTIETATRVGTVKSLDLLFTEIATPDNVKVMIPNSKVFGDVILNYSTHRTRRADVLFKVPLKTDLVAVLQKMRERAESDPRVRKDPPVQVEVTDLSEAFAQAAIRAWTAREDFAAVKSDLILAAHLLSDDPTRILPPPRPSKAPDPSPALPGDRPLDFLRRKSAKRDRKPKSSGTQPPPQAD